MRLPSHRYEQIKQKVVTLFAMVGEKSVPIDPFAITEKLGFHVIAYSALGEAGKAACLKRAESGFKLHLESFDGTSTWYIYYNDSKPWGHVRFTILHEIGHIILEHLQESDIAEAEANFFAKFAIAPPMLVNLIRPNDYMDIADMFGLSNESALYSWNYYCRWLRIPGVKDYELELRSMFTVVKNEGGESMETALILRTKKGA